MEVKTKELNRMLKEFLSDINNIKSKLNGDIYNFKNLLSETVYNLPEQICKGLNAKSKILSKKEFTIAMEALEQCKSYLIMMEKMKMIPTMEVVKKVDKINDILIKSIS